MSARDLVDVRPAVDRGQLGAGHAFVTRCSWRRAGSALARVAGAARLAGFSACTEKAAAAEGTAARVPARAAVAALRQIRLAAIGRVLVAVAPVGDAAAACPPAARGVIRTVGVRAALRAAPRALLLAGGARASRVGALVRRAACEVTRARVRAHRCGVRRLRARGAAPGGAPGLGDVRRRLHALGAARVKALGACRASRPGATGRARRRSAVGRGRRIVRGGVAARCRGISRVVRFDRAASRRARAERQCGADARDERSAAARNADEPHERVYPQH